MNADASLSKKIEARNELRDQFAAAALTGIIAASYEAARTATGARKDMNWLKHFAEAAYNVADAMLDEKDKRKGAKASPPHPGAGG